MTKHPLLISLALGSFLGINVQSVQSQTFDINQYIRDRLTALMGGSVGRAPVGDLPVLSNGENPAAVALSTEPTLVRAQVFLHTNDDDKDHDSGVYMTVTTKDKSRILAHIVNADSSSDQNATVYHDHSDHLLEAIIDDVAATKSDCRGFNVSMAISTAGNDEWKFNALVKLDFSDGTNLFAESGRTSVVSRGGLGDPIGFSAPDLPAIVSVSATPDPRLIGADLLTHTNNDNKDGDSGIYAIVTNKEGTSLLAQTISADSSGTDATAYNDNSDHIVQLIVENVGVTRSNTIAFNVRMAMRTTGGIGHDTWLFNPAVILYFSDGSTLIAQARGCSLSNDSVGLGDPKFFNAVSVQCSSTPLISTNNQ